MLSSLLFASLMTFSNSVADEEQVLLLDLKHKVQKEEASIISGKIATSAVSLGISMITFNDMKDLVDLQGSRQLIDQDCDTQSCMNEIANALGTRFIVSGRLGRLGDKYVLQLTLNDADKARTVNRVETTSSNLNRINDSIPGMVSELFAVERPFPAARWTGGALMAAGTFGLLGFGALAAVEDQKLNPGNSLSDIEQDDVRRLGRLYLLGAGVGALVLFTGIGTFVVGAMNE